MPTPFTQVPGAAAVVGQPWGNQGCGYGAYRTRGGSCDPVKDPSAACQPGFHATGAPAGRGGGSNCVKDGY